MTVMKMDYVLAGVAVASLLVTTGCCSSRSCCSRYGQNPVENAALVIDATNSVVSGAPQMAQKKCPVTDEVLGSMGSPIAVNVNGDTVYVCCQGCVKKVQQNPDAYLAKVVAERNASR